MPWPYICVCYLSQADITALWLDLSQMFIFILYERNTALLCFPISATPLVQHGRKGGPPPTRRCSTKPTRMPARLLVDSSDSLDLSDSSDLGTVPAIFASSFVTCSANCRYLKPYWRRLTAVSFVPLWLPLLLRCHPCICATNRSIEQWPGHRFSSHVGHRPPTVVGNNPARAHTKWVSHDSLLLGVTLDLKIKLQLHWSGVTDSYYRTNRVLLSRPAQRTATEDPRMGDTDHNHGSLATCIKPFDGYMLWRCHCHGRLRTRTLPWMLSMVLQQNTASSRSQLTGPRLCFSWNKSDRCTHEHRSFRHACSVCGARGLLHN